MNIRTNKDWESIRLGDENYFMVIMGQSPPSNTYNNEGIGLPFYQGKAEFGEIFPIPQKYCYASCRIAEEDDILISVRAPVGPTNIADQKCCIGRGLAGIRCTKRILPRFLLYALRSIESDIADSVRDQGGGFTAIKRDQLKAFKIPIPPLDEQQRIVLRIEELTHRAEEARKASLERDAELDVLLQAIYCQMIEGVEWKPLNKVASLVRRAIRTKPDEVYEEMGIRSFGKGTSK